MTEPSTAFARCLLLPFDACFLFLRVCPVKSCDRFGQTRPPGEEEGPPPKPPRIGSFSRSQGGWSLIHVDVELWKAQIWSATCRKYRIRITTQTRKRRKAPQPKCKFLTKSQVIFAFAFMTFHQRFMVNKFRISWLILMFHIKNRSVKKLFCD